MEQETIEEAAQHYADNWETITGLDYEECVPIEINKLDFINGLKWQQERSYSEEEVKEILKIFDKEFNSGIVERNKGIKEWFGQFKKK